MIRRQEGTTLLVTLVMLVVITLLGIAAIRMSSSSLLVVGNMQAKRYVEDWGLQAIEQVLNSIAPFNSPAAPVQVTKPDGSALPAGVEITVSNRTCLFAAPASGYSAVFSLAPEDNVWEFQVTVNDSFTGARSTMVQGARIRQLAGACS
jgi:hypothetical protein